MLYILNFIFILIKFFLYSNTSKQTNLYHIGFEIAEASTSAINKKLYIFLIFKF
jgi:hypothetical protein